MTQQAIPLTRTRTRWSSASTDDQFVVENPATGQTITVVQGAGPVEVDQAVRKAHAAHLRWKQRPARERGTYLRKIADVIRAHAEEFLDAYGDILSPEPRRVLIDLPRCRTAALGGHVEECDQCGHRLYGMEPP